MQAHTLVMPPLGPENKSEIAVARGIQLKTETTIAKGIKCMTCWKEQKCCVCEAVRRLFDDERRGKWRAGALRMRIFVYLSKEEWLCGGNSGRLLGLLFPRETTFYVHGMRSESERLRADMFASKAGRLCVLFPGADALTVPEWLARQDSADAAEDRVSVDDAAARDPAAAAATGGAPASDEPAGAIKKAGDDPGILGVLLVDGTWDQARRMAKYLRKALLPSLPHTTLTLTGLQRLSVFRRKQSQEGRVCTSEALALFLSEVLAAKAEACTLSDEVASAAAEACTEVVSEAIQLNNRALMPLGKKVFWQGDGGHPAWYFGEKLVKGKGTCW